MLSKHLKKGQMVFVQGDLNVRQYTTKDGRNGISLDVTIDKFQFAGGKREESTAPAENIAPAESADVDPLGTLEEHPF
jgi:single-stranded DNA-binding protein